MRLLKFYGRTVEGTLHRVKEELGEDALIVEARTIRSDSATARLHPGAKFEVTAAVETPEAERPKRNSDEIPPIPAEPRNFGEWVKRSYGKNVNSTPFAQPAKPKPLAHPDLLQDLGRLKAQLRDLVEEFQGARGDVRDQADLGDYRTLIEQGVDHGLLAGAFRRWLDWRTTPKCLSEGDRRGIGFRAWLWNEWVYRLNQATPSSSTKNRDIVGFVGGSGVGKTTILAKFASKHRLEGRKKVAILGLDDQKFGAAEDLNRIARLMDVSFIDGVTQKDIIACTDLLSRFDWIGIDTPAGMTPDSHAGQVYGSLLARLPNLQTSLVVDSTSRDSANRDQMQKMKFVRPSSLIFSKLDETPQRGGLLNLTLGEPWRMDFASTGRRVPEDLEKVTPQSLWSWVFASGADESAPMQLEGATQ